MNDLNRYSFPFAKYPAIRIALLFGGGIVVGSYFDTPLYVLVGIFSFVAVLIFSLELKLSNKLTPGFHRASVATYLILTFLAGAAWQTLQESNSRPKSADILQAFTWETAEFNGTVYNIKPTSTGKYQLDIAVDTTVLDDSIPWREAYNLRAVLDPEEDRMPEELELGSGIHFTATVYPLEGPRNPHQFDYKAYLHSQNIYTQVGIESIYSVRKNNTLFSWNNLRQAVLDQIEESFSPTTQSLAKALLIGYKNELGREQKIAFSRVGLSHIMAVSGLHVGFIVAPFWILIPWFWTLRYGKQIGLFLLVLLLLGYAGLTGFSASVCRASLTVGFITFGRLFHKVRNSLNLTAAAAIILLLINPNDLFSPGFQLSFSAVYIILLTLPVIERWIPTWIRFRWYGTPVMVVIVSIAVQLGLFPLLTYHFGEFSLIGPLANAVVVPPLGIIVPYALLLLLVAALFPTVGTSLNFPNQWFLEGLNHFTQWASSLEWSWIQLHIDSPHFFLIWITALLAFSVLYIPRLRWKMLAALLLLLTVQSGNRFFNSLQPAELKITVFDVGQGDAALVSTPNDKHFLVDTGRWSPDYNSAKYIILPHLRAEGIDKLDAIFLSHPHADHIGGTIELLHQIPIDTIYNSGYPYDSQLYHKYHQLATNKSVPVKSLSAGDEVTMDPAVQLLVYGPSTQKGSDPNEHSLVLELTYGQTEFLFVGDAGKSQERRLLNQFGDMIDTDFLKVGHHGSKTSSSSLFMKTATPEVSVVSLGRSNRFDHPHLQAVRRIKRNSRQTAFTSLQKALIFASDGTNIRRVEW
ncbi:DNA internalization-related competence protein ComEC/Rec2 [Aliifodinibius sp. S!AR15-10]|uniref:DNA internalization-related competence protein ComEC/Rec2 n=1 Tax=Aliifodinibius sp. S!AR15-10 TaxID=2950437 RepID=UPI002858C147|nr:DNA internalization-related competence protein ComEC/Rec2 [Aliifodinibius sp. S!AR15-10]MDR8393479.1 DNA internalization-related competence protein ComEC/Rec2 [Aliifodinibius sp. S!AR15-10]